MTTLIRPSHGRIDYYDGVRSVAIGAVLLVHWAARYTPYFDGGYIGVDVFFVLSGFLITSLLWQRRDDRVPMSQAYLRFIRARILRLYPALVGLLVIGTCIVGLMGEPVSFPEAARNAGISMGQGATWVYALDLGSTEPFGQTWSLGVEWTFYLVWPWLIYLWRRRGTSARTAGWCSAGLAVVAYVTALPTSAIWFYFAPAPRFSEILAGCAMVSTPARTDTWDSPSSRSPAWACASCPPGPITPSSSGCSGSVLWSSSAWRATASTCGTSSLYRR